MLFALTRAFAAFRVKLLIPDAVRLTAATVVILSAWRLCVSAAGTCPSPRTP